jgi:RNA polymerase sigma-70 factor (ECF subfamily)
MDDFGDVYDEHVFRVYGFIAYRVRDVAEAEDLTQQTFERALKAYRRFDPTVARVDTWLLAIARNLVIDHYRSARQRHPVTQIDIVPEAELPQVADVAELTLGAELEECLSRLGEREREILALRFGADLTGAQIAEVTGLSVANTQQILSRTLRRLREELTSVGERPEAEDAGRGKHQKREPAT